MQSLYEQPFQSPDRNAAAVCDLRDLERLDIVMVDVVEDVTDAGERKNMNILTSVNKKYIRQLNVLLNSIAYSNKEEKFNIYKQGNPNIGYLKQINFENSTLTMLEEILQVYDNIIKLEEKIANLAEKLQTTSDENTIKEYTNALEKFEILGGYTYKKEYETAIKKFRKCL